MRCDGQQIHERSSRSGKAAVVRGARGDIGAAFPAVLATQAADSKRGQAVQRATPRTRLAGHLFTLAATAAPGRETRLFGLASGLRRRHREEWDSGGQDIARTDRRAWVPVALAWLFFVLAYATAIAVMVRVGLAGRLISSSFWTVAGSPRSAPTTR